MRTQYTTHTHTLFYPGSSTPAGVDEGAGVDEVGQPVAAGVGRF